MDTDADIDFKKPRGLSSIKPFKSRLEKTLARHQVKSDVNPKSETKLIPTQESIPDI